MWVDVLSGLALVTGLAFFVAGTVGLIRFPDIYTRLHALTKADTLGLGFVSLAIALQSPSIFVALKVMLVWAVALAAGATACNLIAQYADRSGLRPWERGEP